MPQKPDLLAIGRRLAEAREKAGLNQDELAELIGVTKRTIGGYEGGTINPYRKLNELAQATGVAREWLSYGEDGAPTDDGLDREAVRRGVESLRVAMPLIARAIDDLESSL